jgi:sugar lactone lactonase YvrE
MNNRIALAVLSGIAAAGMAAGASAQGAPPPTGAACMPAEQVRPAPIPAGGSRQSELDFSRPATVTPIPGVVGAGQQWTKVWQQEGNSADGILPDKDGAILIAQQDYDSAIRLDPQGRVTKPIADSWGLSSLAMDKQGRLYGVHRTERPGSTKPHRDQVKNAITQLLPERKVIADTWVGGKPLTVRPNDLAVDSRQGAYFTTGCLYYADAGGVQVAADNLRTNGIALSEDEKTLFVTNGSEIVAFDVTAPGKLANRRTFARMPATDSGDGMVLDSEGRLYVTTIAAAVPGVHVFDKTGQHLGLIPTPRPVISIAFGDPDRKTLYVVGSGADDANGKMIRVGPQQTAATIYKIRTLSRGLTTRAK